MGNTGYTNATEHFLGLFSYIITDEGEWQSISADFKLIAIKRYFLETLSVIINHHPKGYPRSRRVLAEDDLIPACAHKNIWKNRIKIIFLMASQQV